MTSVSAPSTTAGPVVHSRATARALSRATAAMAASGGPGGCTSGMWLGRTANGTPRRVRSSWRRGEAEARIREGLLLDANGACCSGNDQRILVRDDAVVLGHRSRQEFRQVERVQMRGTVPVPECVRVHALGDERVDLGRRLLPR